MHHIILSEEFIMLRLHGFASSNYNNVVKLALIEKEIEFEEVTAYPPADEAFESKNPPSRARRV